MKKRLLAMLLAVAMVISMLPTVVFAADDVDTPFTGIVTAEGGAVSWSYQGMVPAVSEYMTYSDGPFYIVTVPEGTESVLVTYPAGVSIAGADGSAWAYTLSVPGYALGYSEESFAYVTNEDGSCTVTIPVESYLLADGAGTAMSLEMGDDTWDPVTFFAFVYGEAGAHEHSYTSTTTKEATCAEAGELTYTCSCGDSYTEEIPATGEHSYADGVCTVCGAADPDAGAETVSVTLSGVHSAQINSMKVYTYTDGVKGETDLLEGLETTYDSANYNYYYTAALVPGDYWVEGYDANGDYNGGVTLTITGAETQSYKIQRMYQIYAQNSGWVVGTDYEITVTIPGREVELGTNNYYGTVYTSCLFVVGDTVTATFTPIGERAELCVAATATATPTVNSYLRATISESVLMTFTVPFGSTVDVGKLTSTYFVYDFYETAGVEEGEDGTEVWTYKVPKETVSTSSGPYFFYRIRNDEGVTYWDFFNPKAADLVTDVVLTEEDLFIGSDEFTKDTIITDYSYNKHDTANIYLNINNQGYESMEAGETFELNVFRNWQAIEHFYNRQIALPDVNYTVIDLEGTNVVTITPDEYNSGLATMTANNDGTAIVLVTYDALYSNKAMTDYDNNVFYTGSRFSAIWPEFTGVFVVTVGKDGTGIDMGMDIDRGGIASVIDAEHDFLFYLGEEGASYSFRPEDGTTVTVSRGIVGAQALSFGEFTSEGVSVAEDGTVTVSGLTTGRHIVKVEKDGVANYQVLTARQVSYEIQKLDEDGTYTAMTEEEIAAITAGDTIYLQFSNLVNPVEKLSGLYNYNATMVYTGEDGTTHKSVPGGAYGVYDFSSDPDRQRVTVTIPKYWDEETYTLNGMISMAGFGSAASAHRGVRYGVGIAYNPNSPSASMIVSVLPEVTLNVAPTEFLTGKLTFTDENGETVDASVLTIGMTDANGNIITVAEDGTFPCVAGEYTYAVNASGYAYTTGTVTVTEDGENVFEVVLPLTVEGAWDGLTTTEPAKDEEGVYLISNGAELAWFSAQVQANKTAVSGKLVNDIHLGGYAWNNTLSSSSYAIKLDGDGHKIEGLKATKGLFGAVGTGSEIKNLTLYGEGGTAGFVYYIYGSNVIIENCVNYATVNTTSGSVGGIAGYTYASNVVIRNCVNHADITATSSNVGGIIGTTGKVTITGCYNTGNITGTSMVGGIFGNCGDACTITGCYNTGTITGDNTFGGIGGQLASSSFGTTYAAMSDCYSVGRLVVISTGTGANVGGAVGRTYYRTTAERVYYLDSVAETDAVGEALTEEEMKSAGLDTDIFGLTCNGYPALLWQTDATFHTEGGPVVVEPTCEEKGYTEYTCSGCGAAYRKNYVDALGHDWCEDTEGCEDCVIVAPTCTEEGTITRTCRRDGCEEQKVDGIPATGHTEDESQTVTYELYKDCVCSVCGKSYRVWNDERLQYMSLTESAIGSLVLTDNTYPWAYNEETGRFESTNKGINSSTSQTAMEITLVKEATVSFNYGVSSESGFDKLTITALVGGQSMTIADAISGSAESSFTYQLPAGSYTLTFAYTKDSSSAGGSDLGWFSDMKIEGTGRTETFSVTLPEGEGYTITGKTTVEEGTDYSFALELEAGYKAGEDFAVKVNGEVLEPDDEGVYTVENVSCDLVVTVEGVEAIAWEPVTVYFSMSHDADYMVGKTSGEVMALKEIQVPYFDLGAYGLEDFYFSSESYGDDGDDLPGSDLEPGTAAYAYGKITMLHLFIYATEVYYCGIDEELAGQGYLKEQGLLGTSAFHITGSAGSTYLSSLWDYDENLNYYLNYEYPLASAGWGATSDQILLEDGDVVTLGHFSDWSFYMDSAAVFNYFADGDTTGATSAYQGDKVPLTLYLAGSDGSGSYTTGHTVVTTQLTVYYASLDSLSKGNVASWTELGKVGINGEITVDTSKMEPGQYIVAIPGQYGAEYTDAICSTPGAILLTVEGPKDYYEGYPFTSITADEDPQILIDITAGSVAGLYGGEIPTYQVIVPEGTENVHVTFPEGYQFQIYTGTYTDGSAAYGYDTVTVTNNDDGSVTVTIPAANYTDTGSGIILENENYTMVYGFDFVEGTPTIPGGGEDKIAVTGVSLDKTEAAIDLGDADITVTLTATVEPENATNSRVNWSSSDESVAIVSKGVVTAVNVGTAVITVTTSDGEYTASCTVTVTDVNRPDQDENGVYEIRTAGQLKWFADHVNAGENTISAKIMNDIDLSTVCGEDIGSWTPISDYSIVHDSKTFRGDFNGQGYTISNLYIEEKVTATSSSSYYRGFFGIVEGGTIQNIVLTGSIKTNSRYFGALIGCAGYYNKGAETVINCHVDVDITFTGDNSYGIGGITGNARNSSTFTDCSYSGTITGPCRATGGIIGSASYGTVTVTGCKFDGEIVSSGSSDSYSDGIGGIVGHANATINISDCYSAGTLTAANGQTVGGIVGTVYYSVANISNVYSISTLSGSAVGGVVGKVTGASEKYVTTVTNGYYLDTTAETDAAGAEAKSAEELKSAETLAALGSGFKKDAGKINSGYPVLTWEVSEAVILLGDVNMDGEIDTLDTSLVIDYYYGGEDLTEEQLALADVNGDGVIDTVDASLIVSFCCGRIESFPVA